VEEHYQLFLRAAQEEARDVVLAVHILLARLLCPRFLRKPGVLGHYFSRLFGLSLLCAGGVVVLDVLQELSELIEAVKGLLGVEG
jgi:hypothetical protein